MSSVLPSPTTLLGPLIVGAIAHGGHCVARHDGRVIFVRHALPGELVRVKVTDTSQENFWRGDAVEILTASPDRTEPRCAVAGPGGCGGCDLQHVSAEGQLAWKTAVVAEQLHRLGGYAWSGQVEQVDPCWQWRTRMRYWRNDHDQLSMRGFRSHELIPLPTGGCPIASPDAVVTIDQQVQAATITEHAAGRDYEVAASGFWQVHPAAADLLVQTVLDGLTPQPGERAFDLYCGVGLFAGALADRGVQVWGVEYDRTAISHARRNLHDHRSSARFTVGDVGRQLQKMPARTDLIVLDPPRKGAGRAVIDAAVSRRPRAIALVACDPAALGRDIGVLLVKGWQVDSLRAFDLFPQTHHVEAVAILHPSAG